MQAPLAHADAARMSVAQLKHFLNSQSVSFSGVATQGGLVALVKRTRAQGSRAKNSLQIIARRILAYGFDAMRFEDDPKYRPLPDPDEMAGRYSGAAGFASIPRPETIQKISIRRLARRGGAPVPMQLAY